MEQQQQQELNQQAIQQSNQQETQQNKTKNITMSSKQRKRKSGLGLYMKNIITKKVVIPFTIVGLNIRELLEKKLKNDLEGKCIEEGYIQKKSIRIINYSSGVIKGNNVVFDVMIECLICNLSEGHKFKVKVMNVTKAGLRCEALEDISPVDVFIARDHNYNNKYFNSIKKEDIIQVRVLAQRYELNDEKISVIAELITPKRRKLTDTTSKKSKPKLILE